MQPNSTFSTRYFYSDVNRNRRCAEVTIGATHGLSPHDDLYLWGLLALALSQPEPSPDFYATPYHCLKRLGLASKPGGREFELFRNAVRRLGGVRYHNSAFYDPVREEHRDVAFGFLSYSLPLAADSSRAWRFVWDPIFFELAQATGGALPFDLSALRELDAATRRLYLWLRKVLWRNPVSPQIDLRHLAVDVLGFSERLETWQLKRKVTRCIDELSARSIVTLPLDCEHMADVFTKTSPSVYSLRLSRGPDFERRIPERLDIEDSPVCDVLRAVGFGDSEIRALLKKYKVRLLERWADITLAASERNGESFFRNSPQAYFVDNVKAASSGHRTEPDWWREMRREEQRQQRKQEEATHQVLRRQQEDDGFEEYLRVEAREVFEQVTSRLVTEYTAHGQPYSEARTNAESAARMHIQNRFRKGRSAQSINGMTAIGELLPVAHQ